MRAMSSVVAQPASPSAPRLTAEPNRNDRRLRSPDRSPGKAASSISPASAISPSMIMILEFPISCRPTRECSGICPMNILVELRLPSHGSIGKPERRWAGLAMRESPSMWSRSHTSRGLRQKHADVRLAGAALVRSMTGLGAKRSFGSSGVTSASDHSQKFKLKHRPRKTGISPRHPLD